MTDHSAPTRGEVSQGDREAAAGIMEEAAVIEGYNISFDAVRRGEEDQHPIVQLVMAYRLETIEACAKVAESDADWSNFGKREVEQWDGGPDAARDYRLGIASGRSIAQAIRNLGRGA